MKHVNDRGPNFYDTDEKGQFYLVKCFACGGEHGKENHAGTVATGQCAWCGWTEPKGDDDETYDDG